MCRSVIIIHKTLTQLLFSVSTPSRCHSRSPDYDCELLWSIVFLENVNHKHNNLFDVICAHLIMNCNGRLSSFKLKILKRES